MLPSEREWADVLPECIIFLDSQLHITGWNKTAASWFHLDESANTQQPINTLLELTGFEPSQFKSAREQSVEVKWGGLSRMYLSYSVFPFEQGYLLFARDVTDVYKLERMRRDFVANVSHELRTPLTVIHGYVESMSDRQEMNMCDARPIFMQMQQQCQRMENLVEDLLLLAHLENGGNEVVEPHVVAVAPILESILTDAKAVGKNVSHRFTLTVERSLYLKGSEQELRSLFSNLIFNAVKYTPEAGEINVSFVARGGNAVFEVKDMGIGIEKKYLNRLTERFYRVDKARSRQNGGTGLGLAIVKHVLIRHQASLEIDSEPGVGSAFRCVFPANKVIVTKLS